jgi:hypothetical protein
MKASRFRTRSRRTDAAQRAQLLAAFDRSGLSAAAFARQQCLNYTTFCGWRQRRTKAGSSPAFVQVEVTPAPAPVELVIELGQGRMRIGCPAQIALAAALLQHLNAARPC